MKIKTIDLPRLQNGEHFMFMDEVRNIIAANDPAAIDVAEVFASFQTAFQNEDTAYKQVQKSAITKDLTDADNERDTVLRGFRWMIYAQQRHFDPIISDAAYRVMVVLDSYGDLATQSYENETANVINLLQDLKGELAAYVKTLGLEPWCAKIEEVNTACDTLMKLRYAESSKRAVIATMRESRLAVDAAYKELLKRLYAAAVFNGEAKYAKTMAELDVVLKRYKDIVARRKGTADKTKD